MTTVTLAEAKAKLEELVDHLAPGETIVITQGDRPVARLVPPVEAPSQPARRQLGCMQGSLTVVRDDDSHLEDFAEYM
ncbi:MAG: type II toxin-antitoxin system prevent-host-death family antitoxin [Pirellulales bacterium]|nr:type II toxin-antitoxin system prevent-host-death family antitoxin [Pirellulales bacterium]